MIKVLKVTIAILKFSIIYFFVLVFGCTIILDSHEYRIETYIYIYTRQDNIHISMLQKQCKTEENIKTTLGKPNT